MSKDKDADKIKKQNVKTLKQNAKILLSNAKKKQQRHVKVKNEPVMDSIINDFQNDYAKDVVADSAVEILKLIRTDEF